MEESEQRQKQPARRRPGPSPPRRFREHFFHKLPDYTGPYSVGTMEIELPVREPRTFSHIKRNHTHALRMDTVLFAVYYPCDLTSYATKFKRPSRATWLPRPRVTTSKGYAKLYDVPNFPVTAYISATTMFTKLPAFRNAKLSGKRPGAASSTSATSDSEATLAGDEEKKPKFPVVFFSHGLGGSRTCYSSVCGELASNGFIVVALEHRDGSGARSYVNIPPSGNLADGLSIDNTKPKHHYKVDYLWPKGNAMDTSPHNDMGVDTVLRDAQIEMRMAEIEEAYYVLELMNRGQGELVYRTNLRKKGNAGSSSRGLEGIDWSDWEGRMFLQNVTVMGHSFGGATAVQITRRHDCFPWVGQAILLDAWGLAIPKLGETTQATLRKPILTISSEAFMHWPENFKALVDTGKEAKNGGAPSWMMTIKGSTHLSQSDFAVLYPRWMSLLMKTIVHPKRAIYLTINASLEFLKRVLPPEQTMEDIWIDEGILQTENLVVDELPGDHRPDDKWVGGRLKIPNEVRLRSTNWYPMSRAPDVATDVRGKPLTGVMRLTPGNEVWMHLRPETQEVEHPIEPGGVVSRKDSDIPP